MISKLNTFLLFWELPLIFFSTAIIFLSCFYVAIHNRKIPDLFLTPIWYIGLSSFFINFTIVCGWAFGDNFPLSYFNAALLGKLFFYLSIVFIAVVLLIDTMKCDLNSRKKRQK